MPNVRNLVLSRRDGQAVYHFDKPVVILMNAKCFSATDIFLAGLKGLPGVTLMGSSSGGGSARTPTTKLGNTSLEVRLAPMASFKPDGKLFDGEGVHPDVFVEPRPGYFVVGRFGFGSTLLLQQIADHFIASGKSLRLA